MNRLNLAFALTAALLVSAGCAAEPPPAPAPVLTKQQRETLFWINYEKRLGLVGKNYDPDRAKAGAIEYGQFLCGQLSTGTRRDVLISQGTSPDTYTREEATAQVETAVEFLCPQNPG